MKHILDETKKKKPYNSITYTTGDLAYNLDQFNKHAGTSTLPNCGLHPNPAEVSSSTTSEGSIDAGAGGSDGGVSEGLNLTEDRVFSPKAEVYIDCPANINLLPVDQVLDALSGFAPGQLFKVGYVTPIYFYKKLLDKFSLIKCSEFIGSTGYDYRDVVTVARDAKNTQLADQRAADQVANPEGKTDYGSIYNQENNKVKSTRHGMRKDYGVINRTVKQQDRDIYGDTDATTGKRQVIGKATNLQTILFYPHPGTTTKTKYYLDVYDGNGPQEISEDALVKIVYDKVIELTQAARDGEVITSEEDLTPIELTFLKNIETKVQAVINSERSSTSTVVMQKAAVRSLYTNQIYFIDSKGVRLGQSIMEHFNNKTGRALTEAKRYVRRYYIRPQNIFCSNKEDIIKALIDVENEPCTIYTLNNLGDVKDVTKLTTKDVIYYYEDGILYDKNHVKVMDYDLYIKHEEDRDKIDIDKSSDAKIDAVYADRLTTGAESVDENLIQVNNNKAQCDVVVKDDGYFYTLEGGDIMLSGRVDRRGVWKNFCDDLECSKEELKIDYIGGEYDCSYYHVIYTPKASINDDADPFEQEFDDYNVYGENLTESKNGNVCCICGETLDGYGNNAEPYKEGKCCDACNTKFVIPMRLQSTNEVKD